MKKEKLESRYKGVNTIAYLYEDDTVIVTTTGEYVRWILSKDDNRTIDSIDFEGGPMLSVGGTIFDKKIKSIKPSYIIELE